MANPVVLINTYFLFPFVIDKEVVANAHPDFWPPQRSWIEALDEWLRSENCATDSPVRNRLGGWRRASYDRFDIDSPAYQDMVFFHPFVRRVFFDTRQGGDEMLMRVYDMILPATLPVVWEAEDVRGRKCSTTVTDLRLFLFANGVGILSIGVTKEDTSIRQALWMNEMMRKVYPTSGRQRREGRIPCLSRLAAGDEILATEDFETGEMNQFQPPLSRVIQSLLYFLNYSAGEYDQIVDERMIPYSFMALDESFGTGEQLETLFSRFLYVDRDGPGFRYDEEFTREQMKAHTYRRWAHEGTYYGFTRYSNVTLSVGARDRGLHLQQEGNLIHRMFAGRYYLMTIVALFYRATLLDFSENVALVSRRLHTDLETGDLRKQNVEIASDLRSDFLNFSNYWHFEELANKDEEIEHFQLQCQAYRIEEMRGQLDQELEKLNAVMHGYNQVRSTDAVNRLAMLSTVFGAGAVLTGYFGMNFGKNFDRYLFNPQGDTDRVHEVAVWTVTIVSITILVMAVYLFLVNWRDYRGILGPRGTRERRHRWFSLRSGK